MCIRDSGEVPVNRKHNETINVVFTETQNLHLKKNFDALLYYLLTEFSTKNYLSLPDHFSY